MIDIVGTHFSYREEMTEDLATLEQQVRELRNSGQLSPAVLHHLRRYFRIKNVYHSNAIEGNALTVGETRTVVEQGLTLTGVPLKDQAEAKNLSAALDFLEDLASNPAQRIVEADIRTLHQLILQGVDDKNAGVYRQVPVEISGSAYRPPQPESVASAMGDFAQWLSTASNVVTSEFGNRQGLLDAAVAHTWFVQVHPFVDGNGRAARLLLNVLLMRHGFPIAIVSKEDRFRYYDALEESQTGDLSAFLRLIIECVHESLEEYARAAEEQQRRVEWLSDLARKFTAKERVVAENQYEVWRSAMELLRSHFKQLSDALNDQGVGLAQVYFKEFGLLEFEKYLSLRAGESAKKTWFFRIDFRGGTRVARYLFFFGPSNYAMRPRCDVSLFVAREEPPGSFYYERLDRLNANNVSSIAEVGYQQTNESFVCRSTTGSIASSRIDELARRFFDEVIKSHFIN